MGVKDESGLMEYLLNHNDYKEFCDSTLDIPKPYCINKDKVKAIVLGADPSNEKREKFEFAFGLENKKSPYFRNQLKNLNSVDIELEDIYVQNVCKNYFYIREASGKKGLVTNKNRKWIDVADLWVPLLKKS